MSSSNDKDSAGMKDRPAGFLNPEKVDPEVFDYIRELHELCWRVARAVSPGASGDIGNVLPAVVDRLETSISADQRTSPTVQVGQSGGNWGVWIGDGTGPYIWSFDGPRAEMCARSLADDIERALKREAARSTSSSATPSADARRLAILECAQMVNGRLAGREEGTDLWLEIIKITNMLERHAKACASSATERAGFDQWWAGFAKKDGNEVLSDYEKEVAREAWNATDRTCKWVKDTDGIYDTGCGGTLAYDSPIADCGVKFCQRCGGAVKVDENDENISVDGTASKS